MITRILLPNIVRGNNSKTVAPRVVVLVRDTFPQPCLQSYKALSIYLKLC